MNTPIVYILLKLKKLSPLLLVLNTKWSGSMVLSCYKMDHSNNTPSIYNEANDISEA